MDSKNYARIEVVRNVYVELKTKAHLGRGKFDFTLAIDALQSVDAKLAETLDYIRVPFGCSVDPYDVFADMGFGRAFCLPAEKGNLLQNLDLCADYKKDYPSFLAGLNSLICLPSENDIRLGLGSL
ncbi:hypothetical protein [Wenzhouxiangella limi]|uniref:Uncharacterized protein n=1 Tax=Wenzhouxiangella limi TaxID=2707351 RepID=A0A845UWP3_9GAMM|nr:hypothetical protein [Wenzhouxiangella limi]NDY96273.1 hypothetical protein [Wenzhouxiangella limi]